ncbi:Putative endopeptidase [Escherichia coli]|uniref:lysis system i-spanin subunit Rz n=1 Tax=Escherichia coli TaxID=562 RepID=UPI0006A18EAA|nr:lysis system i-spanin subunit Rz [Escherichia coli]CTU78033.1 Putative endopeptidase [Escherichia coli]CTV95759.1 Putative endopeptidase [Escherichia coli]CTX35770.1 Putative endopeptidase [Escherichia coli]CTX69424.1 Putative endopeptidase [Escherichia coli]CTY55654.1 Putative endopeptidase [Escherichia coli]
MDKVKTLIIAVVVCIIVGLTAALCQTQGAVTRLQEELTTTQGALKTASNTIQQMKERNAELSKLDKRYHDEIKAIRSDIADLRTGIDNGTIRLRVNAIPVRVSDPAGSASAIDGAACRLTPDAESAYLSLREQLKEKDAKITALQGYIKTQCLRKE